jgi:hypothetical protein
MSNLSIEMIRFSDIVGWKPTIGDVIIEEGFIFRTWNVVQELEGSKVICRSSGLLRLICINRYKKSEIEIEKIKSSSPGTYTIVQDGVFYV